ncbi:hypothetical protein D4764_09G0009680 [Takifugu flavidus]|uniref:Secreted protein n=1 Tax=Takifugu flavidus TaxID=433684 RepID=A0A5C6MMR0_9TELE|nr:hypothetical protein D4764_09G0009680 [Takifugu flavidus]
MRIRNPRQRMKMALQLWMPLLVLRIVVVQPLRWSSSCAGTIFPDCSTAATEPLVWWEDHDSTNITEASPRTDKPRGPQPQAMLCGGSCYCGYSCQRPVVLGPMHGIRLTHLPCLWQLVSFTERMVDMLQNSS